MVLARLAGVLAVILAPGVSAQNLRNAEPPAEFPSASYEGAQYVDSRGCAYIRAGNGAEVLWVPRVSRDRRHLCGQQPTGGPTARVVSAPVVAEEITLGEDVGFDPKPVPAPRAVATAGAAGNCSNASNFSNRYVNPQSLRNPVRCGPQAERIGTSTAASDPSFSGKTRVLPRHLAANRAAAEEFKVPKGYRKAWEDDRLNSRRAEGTLDGMAQTNLVWTQDVPRRLIDRRTGEDVTALNALVYPYVSLETQARELGEVEIISRDGQIVKRIVRLPEDR